MRVGGGVLLHQLMRSKAGAEGAGSARGFLGESASSRLCVERPGEGSAGMSKLPLGDWKALNDGEAGPGGRGTRPTLGEAVLLRGGGGSTINGTLVLPSAPSGLCDLDSGESDGEEPGRSAMVMRGDKWMAGIFLVGPLPLRDELLRPIEGEAVVQVGW